MGSRWNPLGFQLQTASSFLFLSLLINIHKCLSLNFEGLALLEFRACVDTDPYGVFMNWNPSDSHPCMWYGVHCVDGQVQMLDLKGYALEGILTPELGKLSHLRSLVLYKNHFTGIIPKEIGGLNKLEILDLRANNLTGTIPPEIGQMLSLKHLLLRDNRFHGSIPLELGKLNMLSEIQFDQNLTFAPGTEISCTHRKLGHCFFQDTLRKLRKADSFMIVFKGKLLYYLDVFPLFYFKKGTLHVPVRSCCDYLPSSEESLAENNVQNIVNIVRRRLLEEPRNLPATPMSGSTQIDQITTVPSTRSSGSFPAVSNGKNNFPSSSNPSPQIPDPPSSSTPSGYGSETKLPDQDSRWTRWTFMYVLPAVAFLLVISAATLCMCKSRGVTTIVPWKTGLSGQLQKAFVTGVPKLNRSELETACEDFSNIIDTLDDCTVFKGTLSSGVEIAVASTVVGSSKDWTKCNEKTYRKKIDALSRINHKNFVNLLGFCEEDDPFIRMMVFEYAPNGTLFEHLHVKEVEHLDWNARMRIIMGTAYCLQYMHQELNPPFALSGLRSQSVYLTDDYAAKIGDISFWTDLDSSSKTKEEGSNHCKLPPIVDAPTNIYSFGLLLLEIITGKLPESEEHGSLVKWASEYLNENRNNLVDPTLKTFKTNELDIVCEVIQDCIGQDPTLRPTMREVISKLRDVISISPDAATPRLSPLWWAELEILSVEAT